MNRDQYLIRTINGDIDSLVPRELTYDTESGDLLLKLEDGTVKRFLSEESVIDKVYNLDLTPKVVWKGKSLGVSLGSSTVPIEFVDVSGPKGSPGLGVYDLIKAIYDGDPDPEKVEQSKLLLDQLNGYIQVAVSRYGNIVRNFDKFGFELSFNISDNRNEIFLKDKSTNSTILKISNGIIYANGFIINKEDSNWQL